MVRRIATGIIHGGATTPSGDEPRVKVLSGICSADDAECMLCIYNDSPDSLSLGSGDVIAVAREFNGDELDEMQPSFRPGASISPPPVSVKERVATPRRSKVVRFDEGQSGESVSGDAGPAPSALKPSASSKVWARSDGNFAENDGLPPFAPVYYTRTDHSLCRSSSTISGN